MSTRSGKRLHNSSNENIEPDLVLKKNRKIRNKRATENGAGEGVLLKSKKRQNYVSFPADEENTPVNFIQDEIEVKPARALRRNTLKEHNTVTEEVDTAIATKAQGRCTRRTKKFSESATNDAPQSDQTEDPVEAVTCTNAKLKGKKSKKKSKKIEQNGVIEKEKSVKVMKKKKNKKKKNSQSNPDAEQEDTGEKRKNMSNVSTDSFHSAAGSPAREVVTAPLDSSLRHIHETELLVHTGPQNYRRRSSLKRHSKVNTSIKLSTEFVGANTENESEIVCVRQSKRRRSSLGNATSEHELISPDGVEKVNLNATFEKESSNEGPPSKKKRKSNMFENVNIIVANASFNPELNTTFEKNDFENNAKIKKNKNSDTKKQKEISAISSQNSFKKSPRKSANVLDVSKPLNGTFDMSPKPDQIKHKSLDSTFDKGTKLDSTVEKETKLDSTFDKETKLDSTVDKETKLDSTFDKETKLDSTFEKQSKLDSTFDKQTKLDSTFDQTTKKTSWGSKSSLITSDDATSSSIVTLDKSDASKVSISDDDSKTENILNTTPLLIESSMDDSKGLENSLKENKTPESHAKPATTPLKREGTFTKDSSDTSISLKLTPSKQQILPTAGCTPYHSNGKGSQKKSVLNRTHSIEKSGRRSSLAEVLPRATRVMFCSPVNNPGVATLRKSKVIKSNLKGSNKSFVFDESMSSLTAQRPGRKRSSTHEGGAAAAKRARPAVAARARTTSAMAKLTNGTPGKEGPPPPRSEVKASKLPDFAALHARRFERMESLDECQRRRARRARQLLTPAGGLAVLDRASPRGTQDPKPRDTPPKTATPAKPVPKLPTLDTLQRGYTRFGFKMKCDVNPFSVPPKTAEKPKETKSNCVMKPNGANKVYGASKSTDVKKPVGLKRQTTQPSLAGATISRREVAKQAIMREKSFTLAEKRNESRQEVRTVIKGVRTNRRFELQMKSRNINGC